MPGFFVFEGLDGAGKSTQIRLLAGALSDLGVDVEVVREPGGTDAGEAMRDIMFGPSAKPLEPLTWAFLMNSARAQLVIERILPALGAGKVVLADRYWFSTLAYQGGGEGLESDAIATLSRLATKGLGPDAVIYLSLPPEEVTRRKNTDPNVLDSRPLDFHRRVSSEYAKMAQLDPDRWHVYDATLPPEVLAAMIRDTVVDRLQLRADPHAGDES